MTDADKATKPGHEKAVTIVVNGRAREVTEKEISYREVVAIAFPGATNNDATIYTVTYKGARGDKPQGTLVDGESVKVKDGMVFNVTPTTRS